jgi:signal transduction histidine kinase
MLWLCVLCAFLVIVIAGLLMKVALLHRAADEVRAELGARLDTDTNTLITIACGDRYMKRLAADLNVQLRLLRQERRRLHNGDRELKEAVMNISHDLRTPLTAICGYLGLLKQEKKTEAVSRYLAVIENRAEAMKQLTEELFRYSVVTSASDDLRYEDVVLNSVLEESVSAYYAALKGSGITPVITMPECKVQRRLDCGALSRIFGNIIGNAIKYSDGDLEITLSKAGEIDFTNSALQLNEIQVGKLFDRFYTVEAAEKSTGLGFSIAKALTEQMNGTISARYHNRKLSIHVAFTKE